MKMIKSTLCSTIEIKLTDKRRMVKTLVIHFKNISCNISQNMNVMDPEH